MRTSAWLHVAIPRSAVVLVLFSTLASAANNRSTRPIQYWNLSSGSHIAYIHYRAKTPAKLTPIVFLHGGPGAYIVRHQPETDRFFESLANLGFDVYLYDQIGSGHSARLTDPTQYTVDRHIQDLEAVRQNIGANKIVLLADSWGATLGANYMATYPDHCAKAIFSAPGAIDESEMPLITYPDARMTEAAVAWFASTYANPRYQRMRDLLNTDVVAAYRSVSEKELDGKLDAFVERSLPFLLCDSSKLPDGLTVHGMGWWVNAMTSKDLYTRRQHPIPALTRDETPVLVIRGGCDYIRWEVAYQYKQVFHNATLLYVPQAGHGFSYEQPEIYASAVRAFLLDQSLPVPPYTSSTAPPRVMPHDQAPIGK